MSEINEAEVMDALHECYDPEIPVNIGRERQVLQMQPDI